MKARVTGPVVLRRVGRAQMAAVVRTLSSSWQVGVLAHGSRTQLLDGLRLGFGPGRRVDVSPVGDLADAARLLETGTRVLLADPSSAELPVLAELCRQHGAALLVLGAAAQREHAAAALGGWAAERLQGGLFQVVSVADAEYDAVAALREAFLSAGGEVLGQATTYERAAATDLAEAAAAARASGAGVVAVHASGTRAVEIVRALRAARVRAELVVEGAGDDLLLARHASGPDAVHTASAWHRADAPVFAGAFRAVTGETPDDSAALGHDAAALVVEGARRLAERHLPWSSLADVLADGGLEGVHGALAVDDAGAVLTPVVVKRVGGGRVAVVARRRPGLTYQPSSD